MIHQILITDDDSRELSPYVARAMESIRDVIPGDHRLWTRPDLEEFLAREFDRDVVASFRKLRPYASKADLGRYALLYVFGGWYFDITVRLNRLAENFEPPEDAKMLAFRDVLRYCHNAHAVSSAVIWSQPGSRIMERAITLVVKNCREENYGVTTLDISGPSLFGQAIAAEGSDSGIVWGDLMELTPLHKKKNKAFVLPDGTIFAWNKPVEGGDIRSLGIKGVNDYNELYANGECYDPDIQL